MQTAPWVLMGTAKHYFVWNYEDLWRMTREELPPQGDGGHRDLASLLAKHGIRFPADTDRVSRSVIQILRMTPAMWASKLKREREAHASQSQDAQ